MQPNNFLKGSLECLNQLTDLITQNIEKDSFFQQAAETIAAALQKAGIPVNVRIIFENQNFEANPQILASRHILHAPVKVNDLAAGQLTICFDREYTFPEELKAFTATIGNLLSSAVSKYKLLEKELNCLRDPVTGLYNRLYFEEELKRLSNFRYWPISIIVIDIDGLKLINDIFGHARGDEFLRLTAEIIKKPFRSSDVIARIGGDEFAIILPHTNQQTASMRCLKLNQLLEQYNARSPEIFLSFSLGSATASEPEVTLKEILKKADHNMYKDKLQKSYSAKENLINSLKNEFIKQERINALKARCLEQLAEKFCKCTGLGTGETYNLKLLLLMHDIGNMGVSSNILHKSGPLTGEEREAVERHCEIGYRIAQASPELLPVAQYILHHHEHWDGKGYPGGLTGTKIPLLCRILAILDAYDAMTSNTPYRQALSQAEAVSEILNNAGTQFDPELASVFVHQVLEF